MIASSPSRGTSPHMNSSLDTTIFLATDLTGYAEDDIGFFLFLS